MARREMPNGTLLPPDEYMIELAADRWRMKFNMLEVIGGPTPLPNVRKILTYILRHQYACKTDNWQQIIEDWLEYMTYEYKEGWHNASVKYQNEFKLWDNGHVVDGRTVPYTKKEVREIKVHNKQLWAEVLSAKRQFDVFQKRIELWNTLKVKYM